MKMFTCWHSKLRLNTIVYIKHVFSPILGHLVGGDEQQKWPTYLAALSVRQF